MPLVDRVLLGADAILLDHTVVNKVGSLQLALAARRFGKPVTVVAESLKLARDPHDVTLPTEQNDGDEVWRDPPQGVVVSNLYFESVPADMIENIVTEHGHPPSLRSSSTPPKTSTGRDRNSDLD